MISRFIFCSAMRVHRLPLLAAIVASLLLFGKPNQAQAVTSCAPVYHAVRVAQDARLAYERGHHTNQRFIAFWNKTESLSRALQGVDTDLCDRTTRFTFYSLLAHVWLDLMDVRGIGDGDMASVLRSITHVKDLAFTPQQQTDFRDLVRHLSYIYERSHDEMPDELMSWRSQIAGASRGADHPRAACATPYQDAYAVHSAVPEYPDSARDLGLGEVQVTVLVTISPDGGLTDATVEQSSGNMAIDQAALAAARQSTYGPKVVNCQPTQGRYSARFTLDPNS